MLKRSFDLILATLLGFILAPLALIIGLIIQLESRGPFLFNSERVGKDGKRFVLHRLRISKGSPYQTSWVPTRFGRIVQNLALPEIAVFWNVLKGEMSIVGPRPEKREKVDLTDRDWQKVLSVKPGFAGLGGLTFLDEYDQTSVKDRIQPEVYYVENQSFLLDVKILLRTLHVWVRMGNPKGKL